LGTPEAGAGSMTETRNYRGIDPDGVAEAEADHFGNCPVCEAYIDMRDLGQVLAHRAASAQPTPLFESIQLRVMISSASQPIYL
jgi:hypothetical protein